MAMIGDLVGVSDLWEGPCLSFPAWASPSVCLAHSQVSDVQAPTLPGVRLLSAGSRSRSDPFGSPAKSCPAQQGSVSVALQLKIGGHLAIL